MRAPMTNAFTSPVRASGLIMIEVLVAIVLVLVGLMGLVGLQARAHQGEMEAYQRTQALVLLRDMVDSIEAHRRGGDVLWPHHGNRRAVRRNRWHAALICNATALPRPTKRRSTPSAYGMTCYWGRAKLPVEATSVRDQWSRLRLTGSRSR